MNTGVTYIEINYDAAWVNSALANLSGFSWLFEWGMYIFLLVTVAILFWVFFDSITKKKDKKALVPRILAIVGFFAIIPAFIFRFTGNADGVTTLVKLGAEAGTPYYSGPIYWNVNWLVNGYGPIIAVIALLGVVLSILAFVIYASTVQRANPSTVFVQAFNNRMSNLESKVEETRRSMEDNDNSASTTQAGVSSFSSAAITSRKGSGTTASTSPKTIIDRKPQAATEIDLPKTGDTLTVKSGNNRGIVYHLPAQDMIVGRSEASDIAIDDGKVTSKHLRLMYSDGSWSALDLGSTNGSYLNGQRLKGQQRLSNGDEIKIGDTTLLFGTTR